jgi:hypothetical protein
MQFCHDIAVCIHALSPQRPNGAETREQTLNYPLAEFDRDGISDRLLPEGEFLASIALFAVG